MELSRHESESGARGGLRRVDNGRSAVFVVEHGGRWADGMLAFSIFKYEGTMIYQFTCGNYRDGSSETMVILAEGRDLWVARAACKEWIEASGRLGWWIQSAKPEPLEPELTIWRDESGAEYCLDDDGVWQLNGNQWVQTHLTEANWCAFVRAGVLTPC